VEETAFSPGIGTFVRTSGAGSIAFGRWEFVGALTGAK
jgi:hypothetical protein